MLCSKLPLSGVFFQGVILVRFSIEEPKLIFNVLSFYLHQNAPPPGSYEVANSFDKTQGKFPTVVLFCQRFFISLQCTILCINSSLSSNQASDNV